MIFKFKTDAELRSHQPDMLIDKTKWSRYFLYAACLFPVFIAAGCSEKETEPVTGLPVYANE